MQTVLPYTVRAVTYPTLAQHFIFRIIKHHPHQIHNTTKVVCKVYSSGTVRGDSPYSLIKTSQFVVSGNYYVIAFFTHAKARETTGILKCCILGFLLFSLFVIMVVKLVHRTVRTLRSNKTRSICQADGTASNLHPFQLSVFLRESKCTSSSINRQCIGSFFIRRLVSGRNLLQSGNVFQFIAPCKKVIPIFIRNGQQ